MPPANPPLPKSRIESPVAFAERVLFATSLEEKLRSPGKLDFTAPIERKSARDLYGLEPGRPQHLRFAGESEARPALPSAPALVDEANRGVLLHFFANHELLAAELMALAILRFRNAPTAFLRGLTKTLAEEQRHTRWYIRRMAQCGLDFGAYPLNRFFWDSVSTMECPLDYVSRLSLTFEQANLDYSLHYAGILTAAGDPASASILQRIYHDEISHVGYGLRWFRKWKEESDSDWEALEKRLIFPLSPIRAKGNQAPFNEAGRRAAGFDEDYIQKLSLYERSRGRTPDVYYFNPEAENRAAAAPAAYDPPAKVKAVAEDLEPLVLFLAKRDDLVLMRNPLSAAHRKRLNEVGFHLPEIERLDSGGGLSPESLLHERKIHRFLPWSKAPDLEPAFPALAANETRGTGRWKWQDADRTLFSKHEQAAALPEWFGLSLSVRSRPDLEKALETFRSHDVTHVVLKQSFATAGSGMRRLSLEDLEDLLVRGFREIPEGSGGLLLEPRHERVFDFSVQFELSAETGSVRRISTVEQIISPSGGYRGTVAMPKFCQGLDPELSRFLMTAALPHYDEDSPFVLALTKWLSRFSFSGAFGIDSYLYRDPGGALRHRVLCEINPRYTMGRVAHEIRKKIAPGHGLKLEIVKACDLAGMDFPSELTKGRLSGGRVLLTEPGPNTHFAAILTVAKQRRAFAAV